MLKLKWENIDDGGGGYRLKIPNGWLVRYGNKAICEVYDPNHYWGLSDAEVERLEEKEAREYTVAMDRERELEQPDFDIKAPDLERG